MKESDQLQMRRDLLPTSKGYHVSLHTHGEKANALILKVSKAWSHRDGGEENDVLALQRQIFRELVQDPLMFLAQEQVVEDQSSRISRVVEALCVCLNQRSPLSQEWFGWTRTE